ncbi:MAG: aldo/keto reductase [Phycisphaerales bacterium]|nr:aldo/keto reductase [Phycisphaerales bacterium]
MDHRPLGRTGLSVSRIGWGTVKIGRNAGVKYPAAFEVPSQADAEAIIHAMLDLGITLIDTAPAYGLAESRLGAALGERRREVVLCTKVGEQCEAGRSTHDFSSEAVKRSVQQSLRRLRTDDVELVLVHSDGRDVEIQTQTDLVETLASLREAGLTRAIGFSGKTPAGTEHALDWADVVMCEYSIDVTEHEDVIARAVDAGVGVLLKKVLGSGHLDAPSALRHVLHDAPIAEAVASVVIGSLSPERMAANIRAIEQY